MLWQRPPSWEPELRKLIGERRAHPQPRKSASVVNNDFVEGRDYALLRDCIAVSRIPPPTAIDFAGGVYSVLWVGAGDDP